MTKFEEMKHEANVQMSALCENPIENSHDGMTGAKAYVYRHGNCNDKAKADAIFGQWIWADCEMRYHEEIGADAKH